ncbi:MAG: hypothetical protein J5680_01970 [Neisseriaceae bacterium]|nr:hypothetical protein [Neisseriaceae bacterium]
MSNEQLAMGFSFCLVRQNGLLLDNASIFISGSLNLILCVIASRYEITAWQSSPRVFAVFRQPEKISKRYLNNICQAAGLT